MENKKLWKVNTSCIAFKYIVNEGLWYTIAYTYPNKFLKGLISGDGGIAICASKRFYVRLEFANTNQQTLSVVTPLLCKLLGLEKENVHATTVAGFPREKGGLEKYMYAY